MFKTLLITAIALAPSVLLMAWALYAGFTRPDVEDDEDFLHHFDDWGAL